MPFTLNWADLCGKPATHCAHVKAVLWQWFESRSMADILCPFLPNKYEILFVLVFQFDQYFVFVPDQFHFVRLCQCMDCALCVIPKQLFESRLCQSLLCLVTHANYLFLSQIIGAIHRWFNSRHLFSPMHSCPFRSDRYFITFNVILSMYEHLFFNSSKSCLRLVSNRRTKIFTGTDKPWIQCKKCRFLDD